MYKKYIKYKTKYLNLRGGVKLDQSLVNTKIYVNFFDKVILTKLFEDLPVDSFDSFDKSKIEILDWTNPL
jgi:hypothetical protein